MSSYNFDIIDYSDRAIALFGDTQAIKDDLKALGGRFNPNLTVNGTRRAGWIFSAKKRAEVERLCKSSSTVDNENKTTTDNKLNMEFHVAIKNILKYQGKDFLLDSKMINALVDFQAYEFHPAMKNIFRTLHSDGYIAKISQHHTWDAACDQLVYEVERDYAFPRDLVDYIFKSVAYGIGALNSVTAPTGNNRSQPKPQPNHNSNLNLSYRDLDRMDEADVIAYKEKCEEYLDSIIELKGDWTQLGAKVRVSSLYEIYSNDSHIRMNFEVEGKVTVRHDYHVAFNFVLYNHSGKILGKSLGLRNKNNRTYELVQSDSISEMYFKNIGNIARIVVYWETC